MATGVIAIPRSPPEFGFLGQENGDPHQAHCG